MRVWVWVWLIVGALLGYQLFLWVRKVGVVEVAAWAFIVITIMFLVVATWRVLIHG